MADRILRTKMTLDDSQFRKGMSGLQKMMRDIAGSIATVFATGAIINFSKASISAYAEQIRNESKLRQVLNGRISAGDRLIEQANKLQSITMFSDDDIINAQTLLYTFFKSESQVRELTPLIADLATAYGVDLLSAAKMVSKAFENGTGSIGKTGLKADGTAKSFERFSSIVNILSDRFRGLSEAAIPDEIKSLRESEVAVDELKEAWGELITTGGGGGLLGLIANAFNGITSEIKQTITELNNLKEGWNNLFGGGGTETSSNNVDVDMARLQELARTAANKSDIRPNRQDLIDWEDILKKIEEALLNEAKAAEEAAKAAKEHAEAVKLERDNLRDFQEQMAQGEFADLTLSWPLKPTSFASTNVVSPTFGGASEQSITGWVSQIENMRAFQEEMYRTGEAYTSTIEDMIASADRFQQATQQAFMAAADTLGYAIGEMIKGEADMKDVAAGLISSILRIIAGYLSESVAASFAGGASAGGPAAPLTGAAAAAMALSLFASIVPALMAEGGVVPMGFNNDTYPALLTSGEMVIPPKKLESVFGNQNRMEIYGTIRGEDLYFVNKKHESKVKRYK